MLSSTKDGGFMKRKIREIMDEMDKIEKVEIPNDLLDDLSDYFKDEIESEENKNSDDEKVASSIEHLINKGHTEDGQQDRV